MSDANVQQAEDEKTKQAHENWIEGIDPRLEVMSAVPLVLSTPVSLLAEDRITDKSICSSAISRTWTRG